MAKVSKAKVAQQKTSGKVVEAPKTAKSSKSPKLAAVKMNEVDKETDTEHYIKNPNSGKFVKRTTALGKKLAKAEADGTEVPEIMTDGQRLIFILKHLQEDFEIDDGELKKSLAKIADKLPRSFPAAWGGKHKEPRHPDHPKGPSNAYIHFTSAIRASVVEANPDISNTDVVSMMAKMWKDTPKEDRAEYEDLATADKDRYTKEMAIFEKNHPGEARTSKKSSPKPTKASAYTMFCKENREEMKTDNPELEPKEITKLLAEKWTEIKEDPDEKAKYQALADEANEGIEERMSEYEETSPKSSKKLSESEQAKKDDPDNYELNEDTGRYIKKAKASSPKASNAPKASKAKKSRKQKKVAEDDEVDVTVEEIEVDSDILVGE